MTTFLNGKALTAADITCSVADCSGKHYAKGYCNKHYMRMWSTGSLVTTRPANGAVIAWLNNVALPYDDDECLIFPYSIGNHGYGLSNGKDFLAHRYICRSAHGEPPTAKHQAAHSCGHKRCVNKRHLRWATRKENEADKLLHGTRPAGERHVSSKLKEADVLAIRASKEPLRPLALAYGVSQQHVSDIRLRKRWGWL